MCLLVRAANYLPLISHLRTIIKRAHKKSYTISVGKPNPAKLANFLEIECFVLVACPENSLLDAKEFLRPFVTPFELEVALRPTQEWTGRYVLDFGELLKDQPKEEKEEGGGLSIESERSISYTNSLQRSNWTSQKKISTSQCSH